MPKGNLPSRALLLLILVGMLATLLAACTPSHPQSTFDTLGPVSKSQANLFYWLFWIGMAVSVAVAGAIIYAAIKYRRRPGDGDPPQTHGNTQLEIAWTIVPALVLAAVAVPGIFAIFDMFDSPKTAEEGGLVVEVIGHQWWFEFRYPDHDVVTANELHIPVGEPINIELDSVDVIHSFWVPKLAGKVDMIPNTDNTMWMQANEPGDYFGQCAEFCGVSHANMRFRVIAEPKADFEAWLRAQAAPASAPTDPLAREGEELFMSRDILCFRCHTVGGTRLARGTIGPNLTHFASRGNFAGSVMSNTQEHLREWLADPGKIKPANMMAMDAEVYNGLLSPLTEPQISALVAYLMSLE